MPALVYDYESIAAAMKRGPVTKPMPKNALTEEGVYRIFRIDVAPSGKLKQAWEPMTITDLNLY